MLRRVIAGKTYEFADTLRVIYEVKDITGAKNLKDALNSIAHMDIDEQLQLLYASYRTATKNAALSQDEFIDLILDNMGVLTIADLVGELADGLMYSGMPADKVDSKKAEVSEAMRTVGATSSGTDIG